MDYQAIVQAIVAIAGDDRYFCDELKYDAVRDVLENAGLLVDTADTSEG